MMKIGIFGGSFNPIHNGHIEIVKFMISTLNLDKMLIVPVGIPSHKKNNLLNGKKRLTMCKLAFKDLNNIEVLDIEIKQNSISYTIDTLKKIISIYGEYNKYFEIIGKDSADYFEQWKNYEEILKLSTVVVFDREEYIGKKIKDLIYLKTPLFPISSTQIREKLKKDENIDNLVPLAVKNFIEKYNLYSEGEN